LSARALSRARRTRESADESMGLIEIPRTGPRTGPQAVAGSVELVNGQHRNNAVLMTPRLRHRVGRDAGRATLNIPRPTRLHGRAF
jgi:hypothetical protein